MSDSFLGRWSRRKHATRVAPPAPPVVEPPPDLPDIESLGQSSDYTVFLQNGVTEEIQALALRRAWASDATIAGFRGMADYDWDFNAPTYGRLWPGDDIAKLLQAVLQVPRDEPETVAKPSPEPVTAMAQPPPLLSEPVAPATVITEPVEPSPVYRRHGSALQCGSLPSQ